MPQPVSPACACNGLPCTWHRARRVAVRWVATAVLLGAAAQLLWPRRSPWRPAWLDVAAAAVAALHL